MPCVNPTLLPNVGFWSSDDATNPRSEETANNKKVKIKVSGNNTGKIGRKKDRLPKFIS
jgi:hypothetical protein